MDIDISQVFIRPDDTIRQAIACIDRTPAKIALVVDEQSRLLDTITDGDVRRAILRNVDLEEPVRLLKQAEPTSTSTGPVSAPWGAKPSALLRLMQKRGVRQVPLIDDKQRAVGLVRLKDLQPQDTPSVDAVIMAGGYGTRLRPLTDDLPKPMLPVGDQPLLATIVKQLRDAGIHQVNLATHFKQDVIAKHFGNGGDFGVEIRYLNEDKPLGTAGALGLLGKSDKPLLVINGDILTRIDFQDMMDFHHDHQAQLTIGVKQYDLQLPYGVVKTDGVAVTGILEKPLVRHFISTGIYLLNPEVCRYIPSGKSYDMPDLILRLLDEGGRVVSFPVREYWLDIGQMEDYEQALLDIDDQESKSA